jgi:hypothetical protein
MQVRGDLVVIPESPMCVVGALVWRSSNVVSLKWRAPFLGLGNKFQLATTR